MHVSGLVTILIPLLPVAAADLVPTVHREPADAYLDRRQSTNPSLGKRQFCDAYYPYICSAIDGDALCMAESEVCCQVISTSGTYPYVCPVTHPYCCPVEGGVPRCGSDETCGSGSFESAPPHPLATETLGVLPTKATAAAGPTKAGGETSTPEKTSAANRVGRGTLEGMFAFVLGSSLAVL